MKLSLKTLALAAALTNIASAQHAGDAAPELVWNKLKGDCPAHLDWASLRGKVVAIALTDDAMFPEDVGDWNRFAEKFTSEPVLVVHVVAGSEFLLDQALAKTPSKSCILFDTEFANGQNFKLPHVPRTVVVDRSGLIAGYSRGDPDEDDIRSVLNHEKESGLLETPPQPNPDATPGQDLAPSYEVRISPARPGEARSLGELGADTYVTTNQPLKLIVMDLWDTEMARISFPDKLDAATYNVTAHLPLEDHDLLIRLVREAIEKRFALRIQKAEQTRRVYVLTTIENDAPKLQPASDTEQTMSGSSENSLVGTARTAAEIARNFEDLLNVPVIDGTALKGKYNYSASIKLSDDHAAFDLARQLGLKLVEEERPVEMLVVRKLP